MVAPIPEQVFNRVLRNCSKESTLARKCTGLASLVPDAPQEVPLTLAVAVNSCLPVPAGRAAVYALARVVAKPERQGGAQHVALLAMVCCADSVEFKSPPVGLT